MLSSIIQSIWGETREDSPVSKKETSIASIKEGWEIYPKDEYYYRYTEVDGVKHGRFARYYVMPIVSQLNQLCFYKNGNLDGLYQAWHPNGQLWIRCTYKDGQLNGLYEDWHTNGKLSMRCFYKNDERDGPFEAWHSNGQLSLRCFYKNGKLDGLYEEWNKHGDRWKRHAYKDGASLCGNLSCVGKEKCQCWWL